MERAKEFSFLEQAVGGGCASRKRGQWQFVRLTPKNSLDKKHRL